MATFRNNSLLTHNVLIPDKKEKIKLNFYFHISLWCLERCYEAPQRRQKKNYVNFYSNTTFWNGQDG